MLLENRRIKTAMFGYQFHFGLDVRTTVALTDYCEMCPFRHLAVGCYHTGTNNRRVCKHEGDEKIIDATAQAQSKFLPMYQKNVQRRIRPLFRQMRDSLVIELKGLPVTQMSVADRPLKLARVPVLRGLVVLQKIGIGSVSVWLENLLPFAEDDWRDLRDPLLVTLSLGTTDMTRNHWPLITFVRYMVLLSHLGFTGKSYNARSYETSEVLSSDRALEEFLATTVAGAVDEPLLVSVEIDNYPFFFIQYDLLTADMRAEFAKNPADLRLALCGDKHWKWKTPQVVKSSVLDADISARDSILWLVNSEGTVKLMSSQLETDVAESVTATLLETDIILTMRYFLQTINSLIVKLSESRVAPSRLAKLRQSLFANLDKYCNIEVSHKDTTRRRIEELKRIFRITSLYDAVVDRFDLLGSRLAARYSLGIERQQILLTIVFGFFGALNVLYRVLTDLNATALNGGPKYEWWVPPAASVGGSLLIALGLLWVAKTIRNQIP